MKIIYFILFLVICNSCKKDNDFADQTNNYTGSNNTNHSARYNMLTDHRWEFDTVVEVGPSVGGFAISAHSISFNPNGLLDWFPSQSIERNWTLNSSETIISVTVPQSPPSNQYWDIKSLNANLLEVKIRKMSDSTNTTNFIVYRYKSF